jgi:arsenate reductase
MAYKRSVLFVCTHNSARSQMAEGWLRHLAGDRFEVASAGVEPGTLHPLAVRAMAEVGIDISGHRAESIKQYLGRWNVTYLIVVCAKADDSCPRAWPNVLARLTWFFDDPAGAKGTEMERLDAFRTVRDGIRARIEDWLSEHGEAASDMREQAPTT